MNAGIPHLVVAPVVVPLVTVALLLLLGGQSKRFRALVNVTSTLASLVVATMILLQVESGGATGGFGVYLASNWEAPFGIVLVADRLSALMLVLVGVVSLCVALYAEAGWAGAGVYFRPLFQIQLMGLNGAFLTGDLFNLFVFFEVMLAASYGLQLHGSGYPRVRSGLHYLVINLLASALFLIGLAVLYGVVGTLSMADLADKIAAVPARDRGLLHAGAAILALAFLIKAASWPVNAWLVPAYTATSAPVAALFALMTKVGVYVLLRLWTLLFSSGAGPSLHFGREILLYAGFATMAFGALGLMASLRLARIAAFSIIVSSGTLLAAVGTGSVPMTAAALFYVLSATPAVSSLFLLVELIARMERDGSPHLRDVDRTPDEDTNLDDDEVPMVGRVIPVSIAVLGLAFLCSALLVAGLPPLSGFLAKLALLSAALEPAGETLAAPSRGGWALFALLLLSGLAATVSLARAGTRHFWSTGGRLESRMKGVEAAALLTLLGACVLLSVFAEPVMRYAHVASADLHAPRRYIHEVLSTKARPGVTRPSTGRSTEGEGAP